MTKKLLLITALLSISGCSNIKPTSVIVGAFSKHLASTTNNDEVNPLLGIELNNKYQVGLYDNSRIRTSKSYYITRRYIDIKIPKTTTRIISKAGIALYDNNSGYNASLKPILSLGTRTFISKKLFVDLDYMPHRLIGKTNIVSLTAGYMLK